MPYTDPFSLYDSSEPPTTVRDASATETALSDSASRGELTYTAPEEIVTSNNTLEANSSSLASTQETASAATDCTSVSELETTSSASEAAAATFTRSSIRSSAPSSIEKGSILSTGNSSKRTSRYSQSFLADVATSQAWLEQNSTSNLDSMTSSPANTTKVKIISSTQGAESFAPETAGRSTSSSEERLRNLKLEMENTLDLDFSILSKRESVSSDEQYTQEQTARLGDVVSPNHLRYMRGESVPSAEYTSGSYATDNSNDTRSGGSMANAATHTSAMNATSNYRSPMVESVSDDMSTHTAGSAKSSELAESITSSASLDPLVTSRCNTVSTTSLDRRTRIVMERSRIPMEEFKANLEANQEGSFGSADTAGINASTSEYTSDSSSTSTSLCTATANVDTEQYSNSSEALTLTRPSTGYSDNYGARQAILSSSSLPLDRRPPVYDHSPVSRFDSYSSSDSGDGQFTIQNPASSRTTISFWHLRSRTSSARETSGPEERTTDSHSISRPLHVESTAAISVETRYSTASEAIAAHSTARTSQVSSFFGRIAGRRSGNGSRSGSSFSSSEDDTVWSKVGSAAQSKFSRFGKRTVTYLDKALSRTGASIAYNTADRPFDKATDTIYSLVSKSGISVRNDSTARSVRDVGEIDTTGSPSPFHMSNWRIRR